jgi:hypothetical protein
LSIVVAVNLLRCAGLLVMPRYFFFIEGPTRTAEDIDGEELRDDLDAHRAAQQTARELADSFPDGVVVARDKEGRLVSEVPIGAPFN